MTRLVNQIWLDVRIQYRNGFYAVSLIIVVPSIALLSFLEDSALAWVLPLVLFQNTVVNTFYFIAGLVLLEKSEGSLGAQAVTPLRGREYLASKVLTLTALSTLEGTIMALACYGSELSLPLLLSGLITLGLLLSMLGLALMVHYDSINEFLMPSVAYTILLCLPILQVIGLVDGGWMALHPLQPSMDALVAAFDTAPLLSRLPALLLPWPWIVLASVWALGLYRRRLVGGG